jgi:murein DD-endopeptidase MepM/ murein hydrolase activator NlpD
MRVKVVALVVGAVFAGGVTAADGATPAAAAVPASDLAPPRLDGPGAAPRGEFGWPLAGFPTVLRRFDAPDHPYGPGHRGVDLGGWGGQSVLAAGDGVLAFTGMVAGRPVISVDHPSGLRTTYEPVVATVSAGQRVARGDIIGRLQAGHPGCSAAACLHWGVRRGQEYLDPLRLLASGRVRLLPVDR